MSDKATIGIMILGLILLGATIGLQVMDNSRDDIDRLNGTVSDLQVRVASAKKTERTAQLAMATGTLWMMEHHLHEVEEALEKMPVDWHEAEEEAEESIPWLRGAVWPKELKAEAIKLADSMAKLETVLKTKNHGSSVTAYEEAKKIYKHLHHEVMEAVGESGGHGKPGAHGKH